TAPFRTEAAYGCLKPVPTNRLRRTYLHLGYSIVLNEHVLGTSHPWLQGHLSILGHRSNSAYGRVPTALRQGPFPPSMATGTLGHPCPADVLIDWPGTLPSCIKD
ncbi:MAG TPA: hypothetical protein VFC58_06915, partial [Desulfosporosinus sp.]|nr:hypothetical protein [Desulfosporosinus sp.]